MAERPVLEVLGVPVAQLERDEALAVAEELVADPAPRTLVYVNAHTLNLASTDEAFRRVLCSAGVVLNDGAGLAIAGRIHRSPFPANLNGSDFTVDLLARAAARGWRVWLHGARPGVSERAGAALRARIAGLELAGTTHGYVDDADLPEVLEAIRAAGTDLLVVAMGNPLQELWLERHLPATGARLGVGVGAFLDFTAGEVRRAPAAFNRLGVEWVWRLAMEPGRMWRRYVVGNPVFLWRVAREAVGRSRRGTPRR